VEAIERAAYVSVGRACGFGSLAILCFMVGLSYEPHLSARVGGMLSLIMTGILLVKAMSAVSRPYKRTETWLMLDEVDRPAPSVAQEVIGSVLRDAYLWYARSSALVTVILFAAAVLLSLLALA
jgi:hypothetical protein